MYVCIVAGNMTRQHSEIGLHKLYYCYTFSATETSITVKNFRLLFHLSCILFVCVTRKVQ